MLDEAHDYVDETATLRNATTYTWIHPLGDIISSLLAAGLTLDWFHEHDAVTWRMFNILMQDAEGLGAGRIDLGCHLPFRYGQPAVRASALGPTRGIYRREYVNSRFNTRFPGAARVDLTALPAVGRGAVTPSPQLPATSFCGYADIKAAL